MGLPSQSYPSSTGRISTAGRVAVILFDMEKADCSGIGTKGTFTHEGGWGKPAGRVDNTETLELQDPHEQERLTV